jgi:hypothetical protein
MNHHIRDIEDEIKRTIDFITSGEMDARIEEFTAHYAVGYLSQSIKYIADRLEKAKALSAAEC